MVGQRRTSQSEASGHRLSGATLRTGVDEYLAALVSAGGEPWPPGDGTPPPIAEAVARIREAVERAAARDLGRQRRQLAGELHDRTAHTLRVALQDLELHDVYLPTDPPRAHAKLRDAHRNVREALDSVRRLSAALFDSATDRPLREALLRCLRTEVPPQVQVRFSCEEDVRLPAGVGGELFLMAREAIHNAVRHGGPGELAVAVTVDGAALRISVRDDGIGFDPGRPQPGWGFGLTAMRERVERVGGRITVVSAPGQGTTVAAQVPVRPGPR
ncbi:MAG TPA: sensor histidine kinase [Jatrophihabitans sp.]|nr:sensor histidine kinase [Jatrophihabitans sp.]